jgi:hypothetical protein
MALTHTLISSTVISSSPPMTVTLSSIPQTYTDLVLVGSVRDIAEMQTILGLNARINSANTGYFWTNIRGTGGASFTSNSDGSYAEIGSLLASSATANTFTSFELYFPSYATAQSKPFSMFSSSVNTNSANGLFTFISSNRNTSTSAMSSITFYSTSGFAIGSSFYLYGIKNS